MQEKHVVTYPGEQARGVCYIIGVESPEPERFALGKLLGFKSGTGPSANPWLHLEFELGDIELVGVPYAIISPNR